MRSMRKTGPGFAVVFLACAYAVAGQPIDINSMPAGTRFCPAPGADNSEFMQSYFSIDARTGRMTRHDPDSGPVGVTPEPVAKEEVLFVSPPISVENVYVPPPGGPARPPRTRATGVLRQPAPQRQAYRPAPQRQQPRPQQYVARPQAYPQPQVQAQPVYPQAYPSHAYAQPRPRQPQAYSQPYPVPAPYPQPRHLQSYPQQSYLR